MLPDPAILLVVNMKTNSRNIFTPRTSVRRFPSQTQRCVDATRPQGGPARVCWHPGWGEPGSGGARPASGAVGGAGDGLAALRGQRRAQSGGERAEALQPARPSLRTPDPLLQGKGCRGTSRTYSLGRGKRKNHQQTSLSQNGPSSSPVPGTAST